MWFRVFLVTVLCAMVACSTGGRRVDGLIQDESFDFKSVREIGFVPDYSDWSLDGVGSHHLDYDPVFSCFESTLGNVGYGLIPMPVAEWPAGGGVWGIDLPEAYPDVIVLVTVETKTREKVVRDYNYHGPDKELGLSSTKLGSSWKALATQSNSTKIRSKDRAKANKPRPSQKDPAQTKPRGPGNDDIVTGGSGKKETAPPSRDVDPPVCRQPAPDNGQDIIIIEPPIIVDPSPPVPHPGPQRGPFYRETQITRVTITCSAWSNPPYYNRLIWEGKVSDEPSVPLEFAQIQRLVRALIHGGHFPGTGAPDWIARTETSRSGSDNR